MDQKIRNLERMFEAAPTLELADQILMNYQRTAYFPNLRVIEQLFDVYRENEDVDTIFKLISAIPKETRKDFLEIYAKKSGVWYGLLEINSEEIDRWNTLLSYTPEENSRFVDEPLATYTYDFDTARALRGFHGEGTHYQVDLRLMGGEDRNTGRVVATYVEAVFFLDGQELSYLDPKYSLDRDYFYQDKETAYQLYLRVTKEH